MGRFQSRLQTWAVDQISGSFGEDEMYVVASAANSGQVRLDEFLVLKDATEASKPQQEPPEFFWGYSRSPNHKLNADLAKYPQSHEPERSVLPRTEARQYYSKHFQLEHTAIFRNNREDSNHSLGDALQSSCFSY